jgi:predicted dehydrogenase
MKPPSILLVGVNGYAAGYVTKTLELLSEGRVSVAGVADPTASRCPDLAALTAGGAPVVDTLDAFFATGAVPDLAVVATPIALHAEQSHALLARGIPVLCEKPAAGCLADAESMADAEKSSGRFLAIGYQWSFSDAVQSLKRDILAGRLGAPLRMRALVLWPRSLAYYGRNNWAGKLRDAAGREVNDSPANNAMAHYLFNMLYVLGDALGTAATPSLTEARLLRANAIETFDTASLHLRAAGADLFFHVSHAIGEPFGPVFEYVFEKGVVRYPQTKDVAHIVATFSDGTMVDYGDPFADQWNKLTDCLARAVNPSLPPPPCTIATAMAHTRCIEALKAIPVETVPPERERFVERDGGDRLLVVDGLRDRLISAYDRWSLLATLG